MAISKLLEDKLALLPDQPGCYIMKDHQGSILYVGKAKVLKNRVRSYFHGVHDHKTTRLVQHIHDFEFIATDSEKESLLLETRICRRIELPSSMTVSPDKSVIEIFGALALITSLNELESNSWTDESKGIIPSNDIFVGPSLISSNNCWT